MGQLRYVKSLAISILALGFALPFIVMIMTSLKTPAESMALEFSLLPERFQWGNYPQVFAAVSYLRMYINTVIAAVLITAGQVWISSMAAFAFARLEFPLKTPLFLLVIAILMIPSQVTLIPNYLIISKLGWVNTYAALIVPHIFSAFGTFFLRQQYLSIPRALDEAARMDGASPPQIFLRVCLPQTYSGMTAFGILAMIFGWNMLLWPLVTATDESMYTLAVGLSFFQGQFSINIPLMLAAAVMGILPITLLYLFSQRYYLEAISTTGIK